MIKVHHLSGDEYEVKVGGAAQTTHRVTLRDTDRQRLGGKDVSAERLVEESFRFLLEREPNTSVFSANNLIARRVSSKLTTIEPSATGRILCHNRGQILLPPSPSTNDCFHSVKVCGDCFAKDSAPGAAVSGSAPQTFTSGL